MVFKEFLNIVNIAQKSRNFKKRYIKIYKKKSSTKFQKKKKKKFQENPSEYHRRHATILKFNLFLVSPICEEFRGILIEKSK
jgi:hypothetical protein